MIIKGYMCKDKSIKSIFFWGDFNDLSINGAFTPDMKPEYVCKHCKKTCKPKVVKIEIS